MNTAPTNVMSDPQMTVETLLRPQNDYESIYGGESRNSPLYWFPGGEPLDERAGQPGIDANLIRGLSVSPGSTLHLWLPNINYLIASDPVTLRGYQWVLIWRMRNIVDYRQNRKPYHLIQNRGVTDTSVTPNEARTLIPAAYDTEVLNVQPTFATQQPDASRPANSLRPQDIVANGDRLQGPLLDASGTEGAVQQGVRDPTVDSTATRPYWLKYAVKVPAADELVLCCRRTEGPTNWTFDGIQPADAGLPPFLDNPDNGVFVWRAIDNSGAGQDHTDIGVPTS